MLGEKALFMRRCWEKLNDTAAEPFYCTLLLCCTFRAGSGEEESDDEEEQQRQQQQDIEDETGTNLVNLRRTIYLTIMSSLDFEEAGHKLMKIQLAPGQVCNCYVIFVAMLSLT
jgi:hypothetical protein